MSTDSPSTTNVPFAHEGCRVVGCYCGNLAREKAAFKETAEDLNTAQDVQGNVNGSTTDRLAERYSLDQIRAYLAGPPAVADSAHRGNVDRMAWLLALHDSVRDQLHRVAEEAQRLQERLDTAEGRVLIEQGEVIKRDKAIDRLERALDEQRWYGEQLQSSIDGCSGNHLAIEEYPGEEPSDV